ncbi:MAG: glycosyltransferase family 2 protein [Atopobiaceae bacterium]|nr:glycosyltransferase family 2 protein [Atopobiaceae bacterium]
MKIKTLGIGRLNWTRYFAFKASETGENPTLTARYSYDDKSMAVPVFCVERRGAARTYVVAFPYRETDRQEIALSNGTEGVIWSRSYTQSQLNLSNSITCRVRRGLTEKMRGIELARRDEYAYVECIASCPYDDEHEVIRLRVTYPDGVTGPTVDPWKVLVSGNAQDATVLESGLNDVRRYQAVLCYRIRKDEGLMVFGAPGTKDCQPGLLCLDPVLRGTFVRGFADLSQDAAGDPRYAEWFLRHRAKEEDLAAQREHHFANEPLVSIVVPIFRAPVGFLSECVESVLAQSYANWELVAVDADPEGAEARAILDEAASRDPRVRVVGLSQNQRIVGNTRVGVEAARGDYVAFLDQDDLLEPDALFEYVRTINEHPDAGLIYCDEDSFTDGIGSVFYPRFKPDYNPDALAAHNYVIHMIVAKREALDAVGLPGPDVEGAQDYDLTLRLSEAAPVAHVPRVLYHWRKHQLSINWDENESKPYVTDAAITALSNHFERLGVRAQVTSGARPGTHVVDYEVESNPKVSVIIPTKDHIDLLGPCVDTLLEKAGWDNLEVLLVENNSTDPATFAFYDELTAREPRVSVLRYEGAFNYSRIVNFAATQAEGDYLYILNNDTEALTDGLIRTLLGQAQQPGVGVVGPLLLFPDGLVQTAGLALMADGRLGFMNQNLTLATHGGYLASLECPRNCSAVLGAAQLVSKATFDEVGGYDEELAVTYNDVDFCWRVRQTGRRVVYTPHAQMTHHEFATRGRDSVNSEKATQTEREATLMRNRWPEFFATGDPELNPECDPYSPWFKLPQE